MTIRIRSETTADIQAIEDLTAAAFRDAPHTSHNEQFIVNALREAEQLSVSLVAEENAGIVRHVAVSPVKILDSSNQWYGLGPISVAPERQRQGIGSQLMEQAFEALRKENCPAFDPSFIPSSSWRLRKAMPCPADLVATDGRPEAAARGRLDSSRNDQSRSRREVSRRSTAR